MGALGILYDNTVYFNATPYQITGFQLWSYLNRHILELKGIGAINTTVNFWDKFPAIYPYLGGTSSTNKFNLKDPRDADAAFRLVFSGGFTHSGAGCAGNGTNGYANTKLIPNTSLSLNDTSMNNYVNSSMVSSVGYVMGIFRAGKYLYIRRGTSPGGLDNGVNSVAIAVGVTYTGGRMVSLSRAAAANFKRFETGNADATITNASGILSTEEFYLFGLNENGSPNSYNGFTHAWDSIGASISSAEFLILDSIVNDFQTNLNRAI